MHYGGAYQQHPFPGGVNQQQQNFGQGYQPQHHYHPHEQFPSPSAPRLQEYQQQWVPSQHYGQYGNYYQQNVYSVQAHQAFQFNSNGDLHSVFVNEMAKNPENQKRNAVQADDLLNIMNNTDCIKNYFKVTWNRELCSIMIAMLDRSQDGFMQWEEFLALQQCLVAWYNVFCQYDVNRTGFMEASELVRVIRDLFKYQISAETLTTILKRYSRVVPPGKCQVSFEDFVSVSVRLRTYTDAFRKRDQQTNGQETGQAVLTYDDFLRCVLCL